MDMHYCREVKTLPENTAGHCDVLVPVKLPIFEPIQLGKLYGMETVIPEAFSFSFLGEGNIEEDSHVVFLAC